MPSVRSERLPIFLFLLVATGLIGSLLLKEPYLWLDEVLTMTLLTDPSVRHMLNAIPTGIDANPPLYFLALHGLVQHLTTSALVLRSISIGFFALAVAGFFHYTNRLVPSPAVNFIVFITTLCFTYLNYVQATQIRPYSLYLLLGIWHIVVSHKLVAAPVNVRLLGWYALSGLGLVFVHTFGLLYLGACIGFFCLLSIWSRQKRYLVVPVVGLLVAGTWGLLWYARMQTQADVGKPYGWLPVPTIRYFVETTGSLLPAIAKIDTYNGLWVLPTVRVLLLFGLMGWLLMPQLRKGFAETVQNKAFSFFLLTAFVFVATLGITTLVSLVYTPVLVGKYLWVSHLLIVYQLVYAVGQWRPHVRLPTVPRPVLYVYGVVVAVLIGYQNTRWSYFSSAPIRAVQQLNPAYPVIYESSLHFLPVQYHRLTSAYFVLDWKTSFQYRATTEYKVLAFLRKKYGMQTIIRASELRQARFARFYVFDDIDDGKFEQLLRDNHLRMLRVMPTSAPKYRILECGRE